MSKLKHPLINPNSAHYQHPDGTETIEYLEKMFTIEELMIWSKITAMKYRFRIGNKDNVEDEITKIRGYEVYYRYLKEKRDKLAT